MHISSLKGIVILMLVGGACGKDGAHDNPAVVSGSMAPAASSAPSAASRPEPSAIAPPKAAQRIDVELATVGNTMMFDKTKLTVPSGAEVHLVLKNNATMATLPHNWALVKPGTEASVAAAGLKYGDKAGYVDVTDHDMLTHTPMAKPGESSEVIFTAPPAGTYPYICTVPGHYMMMKGVLTVTP